jgi:hypothetical protein
MRDTKKAKVIYYKDTKEFAWDNFGGTTAEFAEAFLFPEDISDEQLISDYDEDCRDLIEVWKVNFTLETVYDENLSSASN